ncbi:MAG: CPBP family intramembrane metalloprotease [Alteromonadaceae bacterium]|nr:MAG: CPBP family intramembrane metalloprotease [Alteromonadaceae bacterium]
MLAALHPKRILTVLDEIDNQSPSYSLTRSESLRRTLATLACVCVCLLLIHYAKLYSSMTLTFEWFSQSLGQTKSYWLLRLQATQFLPLISYVWWTLWHVVGYVLIPFVLIKFVFKTPFLGMGWRFNDTFHHWRGYLLLLMPILLFVFLVSQGPDFVHHYPFYQHAGRSWFDFLAWEFLYLLQFVCLEFFFRGFMLNALRPAMGANAVWVMCVPYLMIHFPKLWLEASGAILFGLFLGILALRSRSIWGGVCVHAGIAVSMDVAALIQKNAIPTQLWP